MIDTSKKLSKLTTNLVSFIQDSKEVYEGDNSKNVELEYSYWKESKEYIREMKRQPSTSTRILERLKSWVYTTEKDETELLDYIYHTQEQFLYKEYLEKMRIAAWFLLIWSLILLLLHNFVFLPRSDGSILRVKQTTKFAIYIVIIIFLLYRCPRTINLLLAFTTLYLMIIGVDTWVTDKKYRINEYYIPVLCIIHILCIILPTHWKWNIIWYWAGQIYFLWQMYSYGHEIKGELGAALLLSCLWFTLSNKVLFSNLKSLYATILKNEKLIKEMKKILELFPHGVFIQSSSNRKNSNECFTNKEFDAKIKKIRKGIEELDSINVDIQESLNGSTEGLQFCTDLKQLLTNHRKMLRKHKSLVEHDIVIDCRTQAERGSLLLKSQDETDTYKRTYHVKSVEVEWDGSNSYMHVFIDTTNIVKLEDAKNNIRCQKIMFASASHEFRTPLNAIMNAYSFIDQSFNSVLTLINSKVQLDK